MIVYKERTKSKLLQIYEVLEQRMELAREDASYCCALKTGHEGECVFDIITARLKCDGLILNDLLFQVNRSYFQIDALLILPNELRIYEIKNYTGDYCWGEAGMTKQNGAQAENPSRQLQRSKHKFSQLLKQIGCQLPVNAYIVFINPDFMLYETPQHEPFLFANQISRHFADLERNPQILTPGHFNLAEELLKRNEKDYPQKNVPHYHFDALKKGVSCPRCKNLQTKIEGHWLICGKCQAKVPAKPQLLRAIEDYFLLFPNDKITTSRLYEWCGKTASRDRIYRLLSLHYVPGEKRLSGYRDY